MIYYKQIDPKAEPDIFWPTMGPIFASRSIRKEFDGYPLSNDDGWRWILAQNDNKLVGFISIEPLKNGDHINSMWVHHDFRKKGICSELLKRALEIVDADGKYVTITTRPFMIHVMEQLGFYKKSVLKNWVNLRRDKRE